MDNDSLAQFPEFTDFMFILNNRFDDYVIHVIEMPSFVEAGNFCQSLSFFETDDHTRDHVCFDWIDYRDVEAVALAGVEAVALVGGPLSCEENIEVRRSAEFKGAKCMSFCNAEDGSRTLREFLAAGRSIQSGSIQRDSIQQRKKALQKRKKARQRKKAQQQRKKTPWWRFW